MAKQSDELLKKLLATFRVEADDHLKAMVSALLALEKAPAGGQQTDIVEKIFREAHSLKGAARAVNLSAIESVCQSLESVFAGLKGNRIALSPAVFELLYQAIDALTVLLGGDANASDSRQPLITTLTRRLNDASKGTSLAHDISTPTPPPPDTPPGFSAVAPGEPATVDIRTPAVVSGLASATVRVSTAKLDAVLRQVEELLSPRLAAAQRVQDLREIVAAVTQWKKGCVRVRPALRVVQRSLQRGSTVNGNSQGGREIQKLIEYLDGESLLIKAFEDRLGRLRQAAERDQRTLVAMTDNLLHDVKEMQMLPFSSLLEMLPRFTRDVARNQGKEVELVIKGGEVAIDRRILEEMKDPLIHLLRNAIDHGIEEPVTRARKGKPPQGAITLTISQQDGGKVEILVADDGVGIDAARVHAAARKHGLLSVEEAETLDEQQMQALVFQSGITTSPIITDLSGRGLGLAIVQEKVERMGGTVALESHRDAGTSFRITLPLTLATFRGVLVRAGEHFCVVRAVSVERVVRVAADQIRTVENRETIVLDGKAVALVWLRDVLELSPKTAAEPADYALVVVLGSGPTRIGFRVDEILGEQEVLVKSFGRQLARVRNVVGASVLGTGQVVPVLNVSDLMKSAVKAVSAPRVPVGADKPTETQQRSILVVEDSITSRTLLKNILEAAGYVVTTAVDGVDAYTTLKTGRFDLIVSDVDMPRMNGFGLTAKVRGDKRFAELPVVLVTALDSREDRERGIDVGANAYIVKSRFEQSNLLESIQRLL